jgi:hypothetical protein
MTPQDVPPKRAIWMGLVFLVGGSIPMLAALGVIPAEDSSFHVPRWLVAVLTACFPAVGLYLLASGLAGLIDSRSPWRAVLTRIGMWFVAVAVLSFLVGSAIFFTWEVISPFPGASQGAELMGITFPPDSIVGRILDRLGAAIGALIFDGIIVFILLAAIRSLFTAPPK